MNVGLSAAANEIVLFLDDDIIPGQVLIKIHSEGYRDESICAIAGQVLQPEEKSGSSATAYKKNGLQRYMDFPFWSDQQALIENGMAGNLSVRKKYALQVGGFDENYVGVAYRFETDFCRRLCRGGGNILFEPAASIRHLRADRGGTRKYGTHLCSYRPHHGVGDYYFALQNGTFSESLPYILCRPFKEISTRFHLRKPICIPVKLFGEMLALCWALWLYVRGSKYRNCPTNGGSANSSAEAGN